jgi:hypothetical protein
MFESTEVRVPVSFIIEAYRDACSTWKKKLENQFPDIIYRENLQNGVWYKYSDSEIYLVMFTNVKEGEGYGITNHGWTDGTIWKIYNLEKASDDYVLKMLTEVAYQKGFIKGVTVIRDNTFVNVGTVELKSSNTSLLFDHGLQMSGYSIMEHGKWAKIRPELTEESIKEIKESIKIMEIELEEMKKKLG